MSTKQKSWTNNKNKSSLSKVRPSSEIIAAKRKAAAEQKLKLLQTKVPDINFIYDIYQSAMDSRLLTRGETGLVYDDSMAEHQCLWDKNYPECPQRLTRTLERCKELGLIDRCKKISPRLATNKELLLKHSRKQIDILKATDGCTDLTKLEDLSSKYDAIYVHPSTYKLSKLAAGSTINLLQAISIAVESMLSEGLAKKVLIVDWDVHHGQATQQMFYDDPRVVYFSIHRYEQGEFWPNLRESDYHYVGEGKGIGYNFNIPLNKTGMTNADYLAIFQQVLLPMAYEFQPDLIVISAASGKVAVILEGGYCLESLSESAALTLRALLGDPCPMISTTLDLPSASIRETILNVIYAQKPYWSCYEFQDIYSIHSEDTKECDRHLPEIVFKGNETKLTVYETRNCYPIQSEIFLNDIRNQLLSLQLTTKLNKAPHRVSLVYDERMLKHCHPTDMRHPEIPQRISGIFSKHEEYDLLKRCHRIPGRIATEEELLLVHTESYVESMKTTEKKKMSEVHKESRNFESVYLHTETWSSASVAAGSVLQVVDSVLNGESQSGVAIVRPPGHHAERDAACGFCIFNNVSIAARYATEFHGCKRVLILDWDIHHGNGTQAIFEEDPQVLYISIHRYDNGSFFPSSEQANYNIVGSGKGEGFNVNIPWNRKKMGDTEYIAAFQQIIMPIAYQFNPELILVSAGFDACVGDPLGGYSVSPVAYGHFTHWLSSLANGRLILVLEGGYNVNSISYAMTMCTKALLGDPLAPITRSTAALSTSAITSIKNVLKTHKPYWSNLVYQAALPKENVIPQPVSLKFDMSPGVESKILQEEWQTEKNGIHQLSKEMGGLNVNQSEQGKQCSDSQEQKSGKVEEQPGCSSSQSKPGSSRVNPTDSGNPHEDKPLMDSMMFAIIPLSYCPHLELIAEVPAEGIDVKAPCKECNSTAENWICLHCYGVNCARAVNQHAILHGQDEGHPLTLSFTDLSVWCYGCEAYVDNPRLHAAKSAAYLSKFNEELPWTYDEPRIEM
ncbi:Similar to Hdac6: Histone deacetylase 6 (Mus musculus) [Cotesia congregata]|uniref:Protein deacetylase HDAC6 n=1 Tax=Cotesia congregata TaxID=51543 RepID=A0A8J2HP39_COTCN|nr:Similar to Hdac6: Histone deacetylase 6 (Mus musculus) [Cotesia congregata]